MKTGHFLRCYRPLTQQERPRVEQTKQQNSQLTLRPEEKMTRAICSPDTACGEPEGVDGDGGNVLLFGSEG